jgi:phosphate transport system protein
MNIHLKNAIDDLKKDILILCSMVENAVRNAVEAAAENDAEKALKVIDNDEVIDKKEIAIEEECLKILALYQPVAGDLRYVAACLKVNNDLERIGDLGANIAKRAKAIAEGQKCECGLDFKPMMDVTRSMLKGALDSLIYMNEPLAMEIIEKDDIVDGYNSQMFKDIKELLKQHPENVDYYLNMLSVSRYLERIADLTTNICEDTIYMNRGDIVRHGGLSGIRKIVRD